MAWLQRLLHTIDENNKILELWVRRKPGNRKLECSGCGRKFEDPYRQERVGGARSAVEPS